MKYDELIAMVKEVSGLGVADFEYSEGEMKISLKFQTNQAEPYVPSSSAIIPSGVSSEEKPDGRAAAERTPQAQIPEGNVVKSPLVGTFYAAPAEDAPAFVKPGDHVKKGQVLAIVEAMKLMNEIESEFDGVVDTILVKNGEAVGYGQPLFKIV